jgi:voltage-gated potassium channel
MRDSDLRSILNITSVTLITVLLGSLGFFIFEVDKNQFVDTFFDAVWWSVVTLTSLGYGDIYPVTTEGRIVGIFLMFFGIILIGVIAGSVSRHYFEQREARRRKKL